MFVGTGLWGLCYGRMGLSDGDLIRIDAIAMVLWLEGSAGVQNLSLDFL